MIRIAIAEDNDSCAQILLDYLQRFEEEEGVAFSIRRYRDGYELTDPYPGDFDMILMDIEMGLMNGMEAAKKIRETDEAVVIIFVTNMTQFALEGYRVQAMDYILKPVVYPPFAESIKRAIRLVEKSRETYLMIRTKSGTERVQIRELYWIESRGHRISFHMKEKTIETTVYSMNELEKQLHPAGFQRCSSGILVNLGHVTGFREGEVTVEGTPFTISRGKKAAFMEGLLQYMNQ